MPERSQWSWTGLNTGYWAAVLAAIWTIWFIVAFGIWMCGMPAWQGIEAYATSFNAVGFMAWIIPSFLLTITVPILMAAIYLYLPADRRAPALVALMFATLYAAVLELRVSYREQSYGPHYSPALPADSNGSSSGVRTQSSLLSKEPATSSWAFLCSSPGWRGGCPAGGEG